MSSEYRVLELAARLTNGEVSEDIVLGYLKRDIEPMVRRVLRTGRCMSAVDRCILQVYQTLTEGELEAHRRQGLVPTITSFIARSVLRRIRDLGVAATVVGQ